MVRKLALLVGVVTLTACSNDSSNAQSTQAIVQNSSSISSKNVQGQDWSITVEPEIKKSDLPATSDMKLAGFDPATYIKMKCDEDQIAQYQTCDVFSQSDPNGSLLGYVTLTANPLIKWIGLSLDTFTTPIGPQSLKCTFGGMSDSIEKNDAGDFSGDIVGYSVKRLGKNIRIYYPMPNTCYANRDIDDVYKLIGSFKGIAAKRVAH